MTSKLGPFVLAYLDAHHPRLLEFWLTGEGLPEAAPIQDHCDVIYSLILTGKGNEISHSAISSFLQVLDDYQIAGWTKESGSHTLSVHNTAYVFACLNILPGSRSAYYDRILDKREAAPDTLFDASSGMPRYPAKWSHHSWRVSHWLGGIPSILLSLERSGSSKAKPFLGTSARVRAAIDCLIDPHSGLLKAYRSELVQKAFRLVYGLRHDPLLGDIGGIVHVLWYDHVTDRPYIANRALLKTSLMLFHGRRPFMEARPYCLDFDVVQAVRTATCQQGTAFTEQDRSRAAEMIHDIESYLAALPGDYSLHKLPGALATHHECRLIMGMGGSSIPDSPIDIIKAAHWL